MKYLIFLILLLLPAYVIRFSVMGIPTTLLEVLIYIVTLIGLYLAFRDGFKKIPIKIWLPLAVLAVGLAIAVFISPDKIRALGDLKGFFMDPFFVAWLVWQYISQKDFGRLFAALVASGLLVSLHTIALKFLGDTTPDGRVVGLFGYSPNYIALFLAPIGVISFGYGYDLFSKRQRVLSILLGLIFLSIILAIYFSGSRGGLLALLAGMAFYLIVHYWGTIRNRISAKIIIAILIISSFYTAWTFFKPDMSATPDSGRVATSNNVRWQIWQASIELGKKHPLWGVGLGNYQNAFGQLTQNRANFPEYITPYALTPHNIFLMFWLSTGIIGLIGFFLAIYFFYRETAKKILTPAFAITFAVFSAILIYGLVESSIWKNDLAIIFWLVWTLGLTEEKLAA